MQQCLRTTTFQRCDNRHRLMHVFMESYKARTNGSVTSSQRIPSCNVGDPPGLDSWGSRLPTVGVRHPLQAEVLKLKAKVEHCFRAAAEATGCKMELKWTMQYLDMQNSEYRAC